jgi:hypothetical protein
MITASIFIATGFALGAVAAGFTIDLVRVSPLRAAGAAVVAALIIDALATVMQ